MTKRKAEKYLRKQIDKLQDKTELFKDYWYTQTKSYIRDMLGDDSVEYQYFFKYFVRINGYYPDYQNDENRKKYLNDQVNAISQFLNNCIETIQLKGLYKPPKYNFLQRYNDAQLLAGLFTIAIIVFWIGVAAAKILHVPL